MHCLVFYQYYNTPDCAAAARHYTLLQHWAARHEVTLITSRAWQDRRLDDAFPWVPPGVRVHTVDVPYANTMSVPQRLAAFARYTAGALWHGLRVPKPDVIVGSSTPLTAAWAAAQVARWRGVPWVFEVRDLWPDFPIQMGAVPHPWLQNRLYALERRLYASADHLVPLSPDMAAHLAGHGVPKERLTTLVNGTDFPLIDACSTNDASAFRAAQDLAGKRVVLYAGTFGRANDLPTVIAAAERTPDPAIQWIVMGEGYYGDRLRAAAARLPNLTLLPPQPRHRALCWFALADLALVPFLDRPVLAANSPAKFFDSLGAGTPVVVTNPGWTKRFVETHECGWYVPAEDPAALAARVAACCADPEALAGAGQRGAAVARAQFDRQQLAATFESILTATAQRPPRRSR